MNIIGKLDRYRILQHLAFWIALFFFNLFIYGYAYGTYHKTMVSLLLTLPVDILAVYFTLYFITPRFLYTKKYIGFIAVMLVSSVVITAIEMAIQNYIIIPINYPDSPSAANPRWNLFSGSFFILMRNIYYVVFIALGLKLLKQWYFHQQQRKDLETQSLQSELAMLRQQISPHFLFNTLNNIDALIFKDKTKASDSIMQLSEIMRYMLYEANTDKVPLAQEVEYIRSYVNLFKLSLRDSKFIELNISGDLNNKSIAPMIFVPFIENAFKHGNKNIDATPGIEIELEVYENKLRYSVNNYLKSQSSTDDDISGIGLKNVKRRLEILYNEKYNLKISEIQRKFIIELEIHFD